MPVLPLVETRTPQIGVPRSPAGGAAAIMGEAFRHAADVFGYVQAGADAAERTRLTGEGTENLRAAVEDATRKYQDPEEFNAQIPKIIDDTYNAKVAEASNSRVRRDVEAELANNRVQAARLAATVYFAKKKDVANSDYAVSVDQITKEAILEPDPEKRNQILGRITPLLGKRIVTGYMTHEQAAKDGLAMLKAVEAGRMELDARQTPEKFSEDVQKGKWATADGVAVQRALDMAGKVSDAKARRDAVAGKVQDDDNYREFEKQAEARKLDLNDLESKASRYGWDKNKVDRLKNMQMGLRAANPEEANLIYDAMLPVALKVRYTNADIDAADRALIALAKDRNVSVSSIEYRAAKEKLQGMARNLSIQGDIRDRQSEYDARGDVHTLYNKFYPGPKDERMIAEMSDHSWKLRTMSPQERRTYIDDLAKKLEKDRLGKIDGRQVVEGLRGLGPK